MRESVIDLGLGHIQLEEPIFSEMHEFGTKYGEKKGWGVLRELIALREKVRIEQVALTTGASMGLVSIFSLFESKGSILCPLPYYPAYPNMLKIINLDLIPYKLDPSNGWLPNPDEIKFLIRPDSKAIILNFPSNPTGNIPNHALFQQIIGIAESFGLLIISDEVYADIVFVDKGKSWEKFDLANRNVVRIKSFSKTFGMPGERLGYILASSDLITKISNIHWQLTMSPPSGAQLTAFRLLNNTPDKKITQLQNKLKANRDIAFSILNDTNQFGTHLPDGGIFLWIRINVAHLNGNIFAKTLRNEFGIIIMPGIAFGREFELYFRASFGVKTATLMEGFNIIKNVGSRYL